MEQFDQSDKCLLSNLDKCENKRLKDYAYCQEHKEADRCSVPGCIEKKEIHFVCIKHFLARKKPYSKAELLDITENFTREDYRSIGNINRAFDTVEALNNTIKQVLYGFDLILNATEQKCNAPSAGKARALAKHYLETFKEYL